MRCLARITLLALLGALLVSTAIAQNLPQTQTPAPVCLVASTPEELPAALDAAITGSANRDRTCLRQLMAPDVRMMVVMPNGPVTLSLDDWIARQARRGDAYLGERQIKVQIERFGKIAHLWSTYEVRTTPDGPPLARGLNSVQAVFDGKVWKIIQVLWQNEDPGTAIPGKYLP